MSKSWVGLTIVFLFVLAARLYFAFQTPFYTSDDAYLHVRAIETLLHGKVLWHDQLAYGGRTIVMSPVFDALLALFALVMPITAALKIIPNVFASLLVIPTFFIAYKLTSHRTISLFVALLASFVPVFFAHTFNNLSPFSLALPLFFFLIYTWMHVPKRSWTITFLALLLFFVFLHPLSAILVLSLGVYIALATMERLNINIAEYELGLFSLFFTLWAQFLLYKKLILFHGLGVIWRNTPDELLSTFFSHTSILNALWQIGAYPLTGGLYVLYKTAFKKPQKETHVLLSITIVSALMLWFKLIDLSTSFMLLGITLTIVFAKSLVTFNRFIHETKIARYAWVFTTCSIALALITTAYPAFVEARAQLDHTITHEEVNALIKLGEYSSVNATVIAPVSYGHYITAIAHRKNIIDDYFFLQPNINERYQDITRLYKTSFETEAVELFDKYSANYIIIPPGMKDVGYADSSCFKRIQATNILIYEKNKVCKVRVMS